MNNTALLLIDIQQDYFPGGNIPLENPEKAVCAAGKVLNYFRKQAYPVIHVQHAMPAERNLPFLVKGTPGFDFHPVVGPQEGEPIIEKTFPNAFHKTELDLLLRKLHIEHLVVCGMMTHMCVSSTSRFAFEAGYKVTVLSDATATRDLEFEGEILSAQQVFKTHLAALGQGIATLSSTDDFLLQS